MKVILRAATTAVLALILTSVSAHAGSKMSNPVFMKEFAVFVKGKVEGEAGLREVLRGYIAQNKDKVRDGFGLHPELVPGMYEAVGIEKLNCIQGKYPDLLTEKLNNEERIAFYDTAHKLDWWVMNLAVEEAVKMGIYNQSSSVASRQPFDVPYFIAVSISRAIGPYLDVKPEKGTVPGLSFDSLVCD